jgi:hypothetical protein
MTSAFACLLACSGTEPRRDERVPDAGGTTTVLPPARPAGAGGSTGSGGAAGTPAAPDAGEPPPDAASEPPAVPSLIGDVAFSLPSRTFTGQLDVGLSAASPSAQIRYTTDGELPNAASPLYDGTPLAITMTTQLRAQAFVSGQPSGSASSAIYIARSFEFSSDLPIVIVDGYGGGESTDKDLYLHAAVMVFEPDAATGLASLAALPSFAARAGYHVRGQSSARFPQASYRIELWDNADDDADYPVLGMPAESDWALIAPYYDRTLIRNPFIYTLGRELGLEAPHTAHAEVFLNHELRPLERGDYQGIYWVTETIKNAEARTDLAQLRETDTALPELSGGYIFKFDQAAAEEPELVCTGSAPLPSGFGGMQNGPGGTCWIDLEVVDPDPLAPEQAAWLTDYVQSLHDALHATPIGDYAAYIDVSSFVDYLIVNELSRNVDAYVRSAYFFKDRDGKLEAGPLWDYNFSLAVGGQNSIDPEGGFQYDGSRNVNDWFPRLTADQAFMAQVTTRWGELREGPLSDDALERRVAELSAPLASAIARDYEKWSVAQVYENPGIVRGPTDSSWEAQLDALRAYLAQRAAWIDQQYR